MSGILHQLELIDASIPATATFGEAASSLTESGLAAIAVLDDDRRVLGLFSEGDLIAGIFPRYLEELKHTEFLQEDVTRLLAHAGKIAAEPVQEHMHEAVALDHDTSDIHAAEQFLHSNVSALAVVEEDRFVGMLPLASFCRALFAELERATG